MTNPIIDFLFTRRSIRKYRPDPVPEEMIRRILEAAHAAPSAHNTQPWRFIVIGEEDARRKLAKRMALYAFLSIGFLPLFLEEFERITTLQKFRGGGLEGGLIKKLRGVRLLLVPLFLSAIHRSGQLAMVVELRGLKESAGELVSLQRPGLKDYVSIVVTLAVVGFAGIVYPWVFP